MSGRLVLVVGPSGAGKDTLIALARDACKYDAEVVFPKRIVTRPASAFEDNDSLSEVEFMRTKEAGGFALSWEAHGHRYGIPAAIESDLRAGKTIVCNVSRTIVGEATKRWPVKVVFVTASADMLAARISSRRRASDGLSSNRQNREAALGASVRPDVVIENVRSPEEGARKLLTAIRGS